MSLKAEPHVAFATGRKWHRLTEEDQLAADHLRRHGWQVTPACWDDRKVDWRAFDAVVIRSCWDYHLRPDEFQAWLESLATERCSVWNPVPLLVWNRRKTYLEELRGAGVETVPTIFLAAGSTADLGELMDRLGAAELVIKPTVSASAHGLWTVSAGDSDSRDRLQKDLRTQELMVQPLLGEVRETGEWSLMFFGGEFSHAVRKVPKAGDIRVQEELGGTVTAETPPPALVEAARQVLAQVDGPTLYARVDLIEIDGRGVLMELELIEPWLFFQHDAGSYERFRQALAARIAWPDRFG